MFILFAGSFSIFGMIIFQIYFGQSPSSRRRKLTIEYDYPHIENVNQKLKPNFEILGIYKGLVFSRYNEEVQLIFKNKKEFQRKLQLIREDGLENLNIVADFDWTISTFEVNNKKTPTIFGIFPQSNSTSQTFKSDYKALFEKYFPLENDPNIDSQKKQAMMGEWYESNRAVYVRENLNKQKCLDILNQADIGIRYGFDRFLYTCKALNLPFYLVSGGMTEIIGTVLNSIKKIKDYKNFFLFSNDMLFDENHFLCDMNMKVYAAKKLEILDKKIFQFKKNTIIFGDYITDYEMTENMGCENILGLAFLDQNKQDQLYHYLAKFDLVILGQGNFMPGDYILRHVGNLPQNMEFREKMGELNTYNELIQIIEGDNYYKFSGQQQSPNNFIF